MKPYQIWIAVVFIAVLLTDCRKKVLYEDYYTMLGIEDTNNPTVVEIPEHCSNGDFDYLEGEGDVDCGTICGTPCNITPECNMAEGEVEWDVIMGYGYNNMAQDNANYDSFQDRFTVLYYNFYGDRIEFTFYGELPTESRKYDIGYTSETASVTYGDWTKYSAKDGQQITVLVGSDSLYHIHCCGLLFDGPSSITPTLDAHFVLDY